MSCAQPQNNQSGGKQAQRHGRPRWVNRPRRTGRGGAPGLDRARRSHSETPKLSELLHTLLLPLSCVRGQRPPCPATFHLTWSWASEAQRGGQFEAVSFAQCVLWGPGRF